MQYENLLLMHVLKNVYIHFVICETSVNMRYIDVKFFIIFILLKLCCVSVDLMLQFIFQLSICFCFHFPMFFFIVVVLYLCFLPHEMCAVFFNLIPLFPICSYPPSSPHKKLITKNTPKNILHPQAKKKTHTHTKVILQIFQLK